MWTPCFSTSCIAPEQFGHLNVISVLYVSTNNNRYENCFSDLRKSKEELRRSLFLSSSLFLLCCSCLFPCPSLLCGSRWNFSVGTWRDNLDRRYWLLNRGHL